MRPGRCFTLVAILAGDILMVAQEEIIFWRCTPQHRSEQQRICFENTYITVYFDKKHHCL